MELQEINSRQYKLHDLILDNSINDKWTPVSEILERMNVYYQNYNDDRVVRKDIEILRSSRNKFMKPIMSGMQGYKMPKNEKEWNEYYGKKHSEAVKQLAILEGQDHKIANNEQYRLYDSTHNYEEKLYRSTTKHPDRPQYNLF